MNAKILVHVPCKDRRAIAALCLPTLRDSLTPDDRLELWNDGSAEYDDAWLNQFGVSRNTAAALHPKKLPVGIDALRREHFENFIHRDQDWTHLYLTDCDAIHDPDWRTRLLWLQGMNGNKYIACGYDTVAHSSLIGNTIKESGNVIFRRLAPGISYLMTRQHVERVYGLLKYFNEAWHWDFTVPAIFGHEMLITKQSVVDHIGLGGLHHPAGAGLDEGDKATNPTPWLIAKRAEIVSKLTPC